MVLEGRRERFGNVMTHLRPVARPSAASRRIDRPEVQVSDKLLDFIVSLALHLRQAGNALEIKMSETKREKLAIDDTFAQSFTYSETSISRDLS